MELKVEPDGALVEAKEPVNRTLMELKARYKNSTFAGSGLLIVP